MNALYRGWGKNVLWGSLSACFILGSQMGWEKTVTLSVPLQDVSAPVFIYAPATNGGALLTEPDGKTVRFFYRLYPSVGNYQGNEGTGAILYEDFSPDGGATWQLMKEVVDTGDGSHSDVASVNPSTREIYLLFTQNQQGWLIRTSKGRTDWGRKTKVPFTLSYDGGSFIWLRAQERSGFHRLVVVTRARNGDGSVSYISDDDGLTWQGPSNLCAAPPYPGRWDNRGSSGHVVELKDGRLWMLMRSSQDHLREFFSADRGRSWSDGRPSRFIGVFSCVRLRRIPDGRLLIVWLNSMPHSGITKEGSFHNTARDVLHAAISEDDGQTWRGFREVALDKRRHDLVYSPIPAYDAGIHHQKYTVTGEGRVIVMTGQDDKFVRWNSDHRLAMIFDLDWLLETSRSTDFANEYEDLSVFKLSKNRWGTTNYYSRTLGATLIEHPTLEYRKVLQLGRETCDWVFNEQDGANWNFPAGKKGRLETRIWIRKGFRGGALSLIDGFYPPSDNAGEQAAMFKFEIPADGRLFSGAVLNPERWIDISLAWNGTENPAGHFCQVAIDGILQRETLPLLNPSRNGICYARFRSTAPAEDLSGFLVESIKADVVW